MYNNEIKIRLIATVKLVQLNFLYPMIYVWIYVGRGLLGSHRSLCLHVILGLYNPANK